MARTQATALTAAASFLRRHPTLAFSTGLRSRSSVASVLPRMWSGGFGRSGAGSWPTPALSGAAGACCHGHAATKPRITDGPKAQLGLRNSNHPQPSRVSPSRAQGTSVSGSLGWALSNSRSLERAIRRQAGHVLLPLAAPIHVGPGQRIAVPMCRGTTATPSLPWAKTTARPGLPRVDDPGWRCKSDRCLRRKAA